MKKIIFLLSITLCIKSFGQVLHNGITLPSQWPPRYEEPTERKEMPVPYLQHKPAVIPINTGRQLFVDDFLLSENHLQKVYHTPNFYTQNPVLKADKSWENTKEGYPYAAPFSDGIWYDEHDNKFKMWYLAGASQANDAKHGLATCYAESLDGKHWTKPSLDIVSGTNYVDINNRDAATVWLDKQEKDLAKRFKFFNVEYKVMNNNEHKSDKAQYQFVLKYSSDGIHWTDKGVAHSGSITDRASVFYNPFTHRWVISMRYSVPAVSNRSRAYLEHPNAEDAVSLAHMKSRQINDKYNVFWFTPDDKEKRHPDYPEVDPGIYNFDAIPYESIILGFYSQWQGPENGVAKKAMMPKRNELQLGYSRDGFHFARPTHQSFMTVNPTEGAWNYGNMQSVNGVPIIVGDSLYFYSSGRSKNGIWWDAGMSTGLATLRRDGFVSLKAGKKEAFAITEKVSFDGDYLFVNAAVKKGKLLVEVLDENGSPIAGFTKKDCIVLQKNDSTKARVQWKNNATLTALKGKPVRFKFYLTNGDLYAFWVSPWETGESRGYTAGGGKGLNPSGIDEP